MHPPILTITGSDSTGQSGVQADIRTITSLGGTAATALTCLTVQSTAGIQQFFDVPAPIVEGQMEAIFNDVAPSVVKVGLIRSRSVLDVVVDGLRRHHPRHVVYDPVFLSTRGEALVPTVLRTAITDELLPLCTYVVDRHRLSLPPMHGLWNTLASAVCVYLNEGATLAAAEEQALCYVKTLVARSEGKTSRTTMLYNDFLTLLTRHLNDHRDVAFYADRLNVSARYLGQVCRRIAEKSPKAIIDEQLLGQVQLLLTTTANTMQQIAGQLGFSSQAHLAKFFRKMCGMTLTQYRNDYTP